MLSPTNDCSALPRRRDGELSRSQQDSRIAAGGGRGGGNDAGGRRTNSKEFVKSFCCRYSLYDSGGAHANTIA